MERVFNSVEEIKRTYFPSQILERLEETLCERLGMTEPHQHRLSKSGGFNEGSIEVAKPPFSPRINEIRCIVGSHYKKEGFDIVESEEDSLKIRKGKKGYWVHLFEGETSHNLWIYESPLNGFRLS